ncbi:MAG: dephospho-CoA kinase [Bacteroidales bacterium]|nr:dephospho-CoA kinase [Bacteroidales bacterium]
MRVGVTGGIGSGKTTVCRIFSTIGIPVFDADREARRITDTDVRVIKGLSHIAGMDLYSGGILDRKKLASLIFNDRDMLMKVNALIHPLVRDDFASWADKQGTPYVILESAILFDSGVFSHVDATIAVTAPLEERLARAVARSGLTLQEVMDRARNQLPEEDIIRKSDYIIRNGDKDMVIPAVLEIHEALLKGIKNKL